MLALPDKPIGVWEPLLALLTERGPSPELDAACVAMRAAYADRPEAARHAEDLIGRARGRASRR